LVNCMVIFVIVVDCDDIYSENKYDGDQTIGLLIKLRYITGGFDIISIITF